MKICCSDIHIYPLDVEVSVVRVYHGTRKNGTGTPKKDIIDVVVVKIKISS